MPRNRKLSTASLREAACSLTTFITGHGSKMIIENIEPEDFDDGDDDDVANLYHQFEFPFDNLVFEGGGNKGMSYVGAIRVSASWLLRKPNVSQSYYIYLYTYLVSRLLCGVGSSSLYYYILRRPYQDFPSSTLIQQQF